MKIQVIIINMQKLTKNFSEEDKEESIYYENMCNKFDVVQKKDYFKTFFSNLGRQWEELIYNYFMNILESKPDSYRKKMEFTDLAIYHNLCNSDVNYFDLKKESELLKELEKMYKEKKSSNPSLKYSSSEKNSQSSGNEFEKTDKNSKKANKNLKPNGIDLLDSLNQLPPKNKEIEIDAFFIVNGDSYLKLRENFYNSSNDFYHNSIIPENEYEIFIEIGMNLPNNWYSKFKQLGKLSCFLQSIIRRKGSRNFIIQMVFNSQLDEFQTTLKIFESLIEKERKLLHEKGILVFIDYINLPIFYALQISSEKKVSKELKEIKEKNLELTQKLAEVTQENSSLEKRLTDVEKLIKDLKKTSLENLQS